MYKIPETAGKDIAKFAELAAAYRQKQIENVQFKAFRVPMGVYEQRRDEVYMSRIRTTGGVIYPKQFLKVIDIARQHQSNLLHITTRQEIQIQNLELDKVTSVLNALQEAGLSTKGGGGNTIRNILVAEESGLVAEEVFDPTPYAMELTSKLIAEPDSYLLPRKMKIAFSLSEKQVGYSAINDIGFVAKTEKGEKGFKVYVGGGGGAKPTTGWVLFDFVPISRLYAVTGALKKFFSEHGNRKNRNKARLRFVFYKLGEEEALRLIREYYREALETEPVYLPGKQPQERPSYRYQPPGDTDFIHTKEYQLWKKRYVSAQKQPGYYSVLVPLLLGNIELDNPTVVEGLQQLLHFIDRFGNHTLRFTTTQNIRLRNLPEAALTELYTLLKTFTPDIDAPVVVNNIVACTGADTCRLGIGLSKGLAIAIRQELIGSDLDLEQLSSARIHISGCPNSCGQQLWGDIGFSGKILRNDRIYPGYQIFLAADRQESPRFATAAGSLSARDIPRFVHRLMEAYAATGSRYSSFNGYLRSEGKEEANRLIKEYQKIPPFSQDKNYYFDWGAETIFSVTGRGTAECSAGLFDMIEVDLDIINNSRKALETADTQEKKNELLYDILYSASRMLLVTRGAEPKTTSEVFDLFIKNFIDYGFVKEEYREIVLTGKEDKKHDFNARQKEIEALAEAVIELYRGMDDSLQFKVPSGSEEAEKAKKETERVASATEKAVAGSRNFKDLRGVTCPMNFVQTKIELATLQSGQELEIWLDDGQPINNVPGSVQGEGHTISEQVQMEDYWKVVIRKK